MNCCELYRRDQNNKRNTVKYEQNLLGIIANKS